MITVTLVLPNGKSGNIKINENFTISDIKNSIIEDLKNVLKHTDATKYVLALSAKDDKISISEMRIQNGEFIYLIDTLNSSGNVIEIINASDFI